MATPVVNTDVDSREELLHLLAEAAEFEHNLLCCYLYAAFSLRSPDDRTLSADEQRHVDAWRKAIYSVAIEEMNHLVLVANLTVAIGGRAHFNRPNMPVAPGYHPAGIVVELAGFAEATLDHFIFLERPSDVELPRADGFEPDVHYLRGTRPGMALMPSAYDYRTIAEFYACIRAGFQSLSRRLGDTLFVAGASHQVGPDDMQLPGLNTVETLQQALQAVDTIVTQGEGAPGCDDASHYRRFCEVSEQFIALKAARPAFEPAHPCARNPVMRRPANSEGRVLIDDPRAAAVLDFANALYNHMLRLLGQAFGRHEPAPAPYRRLLLESAVELMHAFATAGIYLATLPASAQRRAETAGVTFTVMRATETLVEGPAESILIRERFGELARAAAVLVEAHPPLAKVPELLAGLERRFAAAAMHDPH
jgi:hypothetical protein